MDGGSNGAMTRVNQNRSQAALTETPLLSHAQFNSSIKMGVRSTFFLAGSLKLAVTLLAASMVTVQMPVPVQAPDQPMKVLPASAVALNTTTVRLV